MSTVRLGLCCSKPESFLCSPAQSSLENAVEFFQVAQTGIGPDEALLSLARIDAGAADLEGGLREAVESDVTHVLFLSPRTLFPFYSLQSLLDMEVDAVSGISWTWRVGESQPPEIFPRIGHFDPEGRPYPYFGWRAPDLFEVDWCALDCLLLTRETIEEISGPLAATRGLEPALRISQSLRARGIRILVDSSIQCPRAVGVPGPPPASPSFPQRHSETSLRGRWSLADPADAAVGARLRLVPNPAAWREFSRDRAHRVLPLGAVYDPAYRGREWYRAWVASVLASPSVE